jgi:dienelactone hydrolase
MRDRRLRWVLPLVAVVAAVACWAVRPTGSGVSSTPVDDGGDAAVRYRGGASPPAGAPTTTEATADPNRPGQVATAPPATEPFALGVRRFNFNRGHNRPLRTILLYPAEGTAGQTAKSNAPPASGRFPLVLFSHGLTSSPEAMLVVTTKIAAAGFVVAAPAYPFTSRGGASFNPDDMSNQPADASTVITQVLKLNTRPGDPLAGHIDPTRVGAGGHSAGGFTTAGMLSDSSRDPRVKAGIIISGGSKNDQFSDPITPVLFIHGDKDKVVSYAKGHAAYDKLTWPKGFLTILGGDHTSPMTNPASTRTMVDFLRWTLDGDEAARTRLALDATVAGHSRYESSQ